MRVEYPDKYAETLLSISQPEEGYTVQRIRALYGRGERNINLKILSRFTSPIRQYSLMTRDRYRRAQTFTGWTKTSRRY